MVRGGGYGRGAGAIAASRSNAPSTGSSSTAGVRSWARARLYTKNVGNPAPSRSQYYYSSARPAGPPGAAGSVARRGRNFAISRGRYDPSYVRVGYYRYFPRMSRGGGYARGGAMMGGARAQTTGGNVSEHAASYRRGGVGSISATAANTRGAAAAGRGRGGRGGGMGRGGGVRGFARGVFRRRGGPGAFRGRGRGRGGAGFGRGGRRGGGGALNKEALDAELDKYMGEDNIKKRLDNELEKYFSRSGGGGAAAGAGAAGTGSATAGGEQGAGVVGGAGPGSAVVDPAAGGAGAAAAGAAAGSGDATTNGTLKATGGMDVSMDNSL